MMVPPPFLLVRLLHPFSPLLPCAASPPDCSGVLETRRSHSRPLPRVSGVHPESHAGAWTLNELVHCAHLVHRVHRVHGAERAAVAALAPVGGKLREAGSAPRALRASGFGPRLWRHWGTALTRLLAHCLLQAVRHDSHASDIRISHVPVTRRRTGRAMNGSLSAIGAR
jgi:hypothetical protein